MRWKVTYRAEAVGAAKLASDVFEAEFIVSGPGDCLAFVGSGNSVQQPLALVPLRGVRRIELLPETEGRPAD